MKKAIVINPFERTVREVEISDGISDIQKHIGEAVGESCTFDCAELDANHTVYVDDNGMFGANGQAFFDLGLYQPFAGCGVILGFDAETGESLDATVTVEEITAKVKHYTRQEIQKIYA